MKRIILLFALPGAVVMNGTVIDGWLAGARVHETGQARIQTALASSARSGSLRRRRRPST